MVRDLLTGLAMALLSMGAHAAEPETTPVHKHDHPHTHVHKTDAAPKDAPPTKTESKPKPVQIGEAVPDFQVKQLDGTEVSWRDLQQAGEAKQPLVFVFWCSYCGSCRGVEDEFAKMVKTYEGKARLLALDCNADDTAEKISKMLAARKLALPVVHDPKGKPADLFAVRTTTTAVLIDAEGKLRYQGRIHEGTAKPHLVNALTAVLAGKDIEITRSDEVGCPIQRE